jgi:hypothetical protein
MTEFTIPAPELARLTHNALAFMPARSAVKVCRLAFDYGEMSIMATDLFTVGYDRWGGPTSPNEHVFIDLSREDLMSIDKYVRGLKKDEIAVQIAHEDGITITHDGHPEGWLHAHGMRDPEDLWERCDELLKRLEWDEETTVPEHLTLDPKMFSAFGKVKPAGGKECIADLYFQNLEDQILVKIGATFRGAIMPVDRSEAAASESVGAEGLWSGE